MAKEILKIPEEAIKHFVTQEILDDLKVMGYIFIDKIDGSGGFILPAIPGTEDIINELLKDPQYILRDKEA